MTDNLIIVRGGGDIATGTIYKLYQCGFPVLVLEAEKPSAIRRNVAFSEAVYKGTHQVEDVTCTLVKDAAQAKKVLTDGGLPILVDPEGTSIEMLRPMAVVDGILAKKNLGTHRGMAPVTIALGPGFTAGRDVDAVIETMRGHSLGRIIYEGQAIADTGIPGPIGGFTKERVIHSPGKGILKNIRHVTDQVRKGEIIASVEVYDEYGEKEINAEPKESVPVYATIDGLLRGLIRDGYPVTEGFKIADIDPRLNEYENCFTISDKARCIAGGVLEAILHLRKKGQEQ